ncbi:MAG: O-antigen ligase family protein [Bryobacterales bacterium]|nr:O-antigen ligase family protein [Bryobacterales bacterium]
MSAFFILAVLLGHAALGLVCSSSSTISTLHGIVAFGFGLYLVAVKAPLEEVAYVGAYIAGAEVLWRMTGSKVFWEFAKYAIAVLFVAAWLRLRVRRKSDLAILYFVLMLPSLVMTFLGLPFHIARQEVSFNLSGPFALMVCACFFVNLNLSLPTLHRLFLAFMAPAMGILAIAVYGILTAKRIAFGSNSSFATSGGYGPNQVASILGMAALLCAFILIQSKRLRFGTALVVGGAAVVFAGQSAMTFSRGGLIAAASVGVLGAIFLARSKQQRVRLLVAGLVLYLVGTFLIGPTLDNFTGGALGRRFSDGNVSRRDRLVMADLRIFAENPLFGLGPGTAMIERERISGIGIAHTEFTRVLSDHGSLGLAAMGMLFLIAIQRLLAMNTPLGRCMAVSMIAWTLLYMSINGMRLASASFFFGLGCARYVDNERRLALLLTDPATTKPGHTRRSRLKRHAEGC